MLKVITGKARDPEFNSYLSGVCEGLDADVSDLTNFNPLFWACRRTTLYFRYFAAVFVRHGERSIACGMRRHFFSMTVSHETFYRPWCSARGY